MNNAVKNTVAPPFRNIKDTNLQKCHILRVNIVPI